jgi:group I intron endonuclease
MEGIYIIRFNNGDTYIGRSCNVTKRINGHKANLKANTHKNPIMQNVYNKYGLYSWTLLESVSPDRQGEREMYWIEQLSPRLNLTKGGDGGELLTEEEKERRKVEVYNEKYRSNMSKVMKSLTLPQELITERGKKISESRKKLYEDPERKKWLIEHSGIHNSKGYLNQKKGGESPNAKKVINIETGEIYNSLKDVARIYNRNYKTLVCILNEYKGSNKTNFRYLDKM